MRREPVIEVIDDVMANILRRKTGAERLKIADAMFNSARELIKGSVRKMHPDWNAQQIDRETARRVASDAD